MQVTIHAALLIALPAAVVIALVAAKRRAPTSRQIVIALAVAVFGMIAAQEFNQHGCLEGVPRTQWLILGPCVLLVLLYLNSKAWRWVMGMVMFVGMIGLSCHFTELVHESGWTGNPYWDGGADTLLRSLRKSAETMVADSKSAKADLPAGWLRDLPVWPDVQHILGERHVARREISQTWHTWLTGLYRYSRVPQDYWYPGGAPVDSFSHLELRDRPGQ